MRLYYRLLLAAGILIVDLLVFFIPLTAVLTAYVVIFRPTWYSRLVDNIYW